MIPTSAFVEMTRLVRPGRYRARSAVLIHLTLHFLVAVVNTLNTKTHSSKEIGEFCSKMQVLKAFAIANRG